VFTYAAFTRNIERQEVEHKKDLEDVIKQYKKNIATIDEIGRKCSEDITNTTYLKIFLYFIHCGQMNVVFFIKYHILCFIVSDMRRDSLVYIKRGNARNRTYNQAC